jgi:hypothetical protein
MTPNVHTPSRTANRDEQTARATDARCFASPLRVTAALLLLAVLAVAQAQARFGPSTAAFSGGPSTVGVSLQHDGDGVVVQLVPSGHGSLPNASTGFVGDVPTDVLGRVDAQRALDQSADLLSMAGGVVLLHEDQRVLDIASAYRAAFGALGLSLVGEVTRGNGRELTFQVGSRTLRVAALQQGHDAQVYIGR